MDIFEFPKGIFCYKVKKWDAPIRAGGKAVRQSD